MFETDCFVLPEGSRQAVPPSSQLVIEAYHNHWYSLLRRFAPRNDGILGGEREHDGGIVAIVLSHYMHYSSLRSDDRGEAICVPKKLTYLAMPLLFLKKLWEFSETND